MSFTIPPKKRIQQNNKSSHRSYSRMQYAGTALGQGDTLTLSARNSIARTCGARPNQALCGAGAFTSLSKKQT
jgi:hypothetical protein